MKKALITGISGQDGSYLAQLLLEKNYQVVGMVSPKYDLGSGNLEKIKDQLIFEPGDLLDKSSISKIIRKHQPNEIYNLAGMTFVPRSWEEPSFTFDVNSLGVARILESIVGSSTESKLFQAGSSRMFGRAEESPQNENTAFAPEDPYAISKVAAYHLVEVFRVKHQVFAANGIMFNHESERRGEEFVTRKITLTAAKIKLGMEHELVLGNLEDKQDWGYAPDYVEAMWQILQLDNPEDFVLASGKTHSVRDICSIAFEHLALDYHQFIKLDPKLARTKQTHTPCGDPTKAKKTFNFSPKTDFHSMITKMVDHDLSLLKQ